ncbi:MAG: iron-containing alcohol dehydrogenase [Methanomassiliicoccaceae archaeon]|nr:iron-containing alcohol dehydrogenase [Methanomassiliicoccaceae archaeon]
MKGRSHISVYRGTGAVLNNPDVLASLGKRILIVTSRTAGERSGALADVRAVLNDSGISYSVCDSVRPNPDLDDCLAVADIAKAFGADALVAIGGGSPLDVAKIVSVLAAGMKASDLSENVSEVPALPFVAIPTTAGSGSEVTRYAVILDHKDRSKRTVAGDPLYPAAVFLDGRYTENLPLNVTRYTALDALSHLVEGYISNKATNESDSLAIDGMRLFGMAKNALVNGKLDHNDRTRLLDASHLGGLVIDITRSNAPHAMGYHLTYVHGVPHGAACAVFLPEFLRFNAQAGGEKIKRLLEALGMKDMNEFEDLVISLLENDVRIADAEIREMIPVIASHSRASNSPRPLAEEDLFAIAKRSVGNRETSL